MAHLTNTPTTPFRFTSALFTVLSPVRTSTLGSTASTAGLGGKAEWCSPTTTASTVASPVGQTQGPSAEDVERFRDAYATTDPIGELPYTYAAQTGGSNSSPQPAGQSAAPVTDPSARIPTPPWMSEHEVRPSKRQKTTRSSEKVTKLVAQPRAGREEGGEATVPAPAPRRNPPRRAREPRKLEATTTPKGLATKSRRTTAAKPPLPIKSERTAPAKSSTSRSRKDVKRVKGKAASGKRGLCGVGVASDEARRSGAQRKPVAGAGAGTAKGGRANPARGVTAQRLPLVDDQSGSTSSGEEEVD